MNSASISARERQILWLMASGKTSRAIAEELYISVKTVETHRRNLLERLRAANACQLVYIAAKANLI